MVTKKVVEQTASSSLARTISTVTVQEKSDSEFDDNENIYDNKLSRTEEDIKDFQLKKGGSLSSWSGQGPPPIPSKPEIIKNINNKKRQDELEQRHQELLARQSNFRNNISACRICRKKQLVWH